MDERKMDPEMKLNAGLNEEPVQEEGVQEEGPEREGLSLEESFVRLDEMIENCRTRIPPWRRLSVCIRRAWPW